ncbi:MAG TPA: hypothetical protein VM597_27955 [Gemmataceae bacterium]|nr:hypothetical protein [Gemmataceae bacterium]
MLTRWKILACSLTVGVGGLAVFATPPTDEKKEPPPLPKLTVKPDSPPNGTDTPVPPTGAKPGAGLEFDLDLPPLPKPADKPKPLTIDLDVPSPPPVVIPVKGEADDKKPAIKKDEPKPAADPFIAPPIPDVKPAPVPPPDLKPSVPPPPPAPEVKTPVVPLPPPIKPDDLKPVPFPEATKAPPAAPEPPRAPTVVRPGERGEPAKLKMLLRMGDGNPRFEIRNAATTELLLKVYGDKIDLQAPAASKTSVAGVSATGKVRFTAPGIEGHCDALKIMSATGEVLLEGNIRLKSKGGKAWSELTAERMVYQIGNAGLVAPKPTVKAVGFTGE